MSLVDFLPPHSWQDFNAQLQLELRMDPKTQTVFAFRGMRHALAELVLAYSKQFPQKTNVYYLKGVDPFIEEAILPLAKDGLDLHGISFADLESPDVLVKKIEGKKDLLVMVSADDPFFARKFNLEKLKSALSSVNVVCLELHHSTQDCLNPVSKHSIRVHALDGQLAIAFSGPRARPFCVISDKLQWHDDLKPIVEKLARNQEEKAELIRNFEDGRPADGLPLFTGAEARRYDRAIVYWPDLDGAAMMHFLARELKLALKPPGIEERLETLSLSRWGGLKTFDFLLAQGYDAKALRGSLMIHQSLIVPGLAEAMVTARRTILQMQTGKKE